MFKFKMQRRQMIERFIFACISFSVIFLFKGKPAQAACFTHTHTSGCYREVTRWCDQSNHIAISTPYTQEGYCPNCGRTVTLQCCDYYDRCTFERQSMRLTGTSKMCSQCYAVIEDGMADVAGHYYNDMECFCGYSEGQAIAYVTLSAANTGWTNGTVTINASVEGNISLAGSPYNFGNGYTSSASFEVSENGTYYVTVRASDGSTVSESVSVSNIDKEAPVINAITKDIEGWTETGLTVSVEASDALSGADGLEYSFDGGAWTADNSYFVNTNHTVTVSVKDPAGNIGTGSIIIDRIGIDPEILAQREAAERALREEEELRARQEAMEAQRREEEAREEEKRQEEALKKAEMEAQSGKEETATTNSSAEKSDAQNRKPSKEQTSGGKSEERSKNNGDSVSSCDISGNEIINSDVSSNDVSSNDVSGNDISSNETSFDDVSSNLVPVYDFSSSDGMGNSGGGLYDTDSIYMENSSKADIMEKSIWKQLKVTYKELMFTGALLMLLGVILVLGSTVIYTKEDGKVKIFSSARLKNEDGKNVVLIPKGKLRQSGDYHIFFAPLSPLRSGNPLYVRVADSGEEIPCDSKKGFKFRSSK